MSKLPYHDPHTDTVTRTLVEELRNRWPQLETQTTNGGAVSPVGTLLVSLRPKGEKEWRYQLKIFVDSPRSALDFRVHVEVQGKGVLPRVIYHDLARPADNAAIVALCRDTILAELSRYCPELNGENE